MYTLLDEDMKKLIATYILQEMQLCIPFFWKPRLEILLFEIN